MLSTVRMLSSVNANREMFEKYRGFDGANQIRESFRGILMRARLSSSLLTKCLIQAPAPARFT